MSGALRRAAKLLMSPLRAYNEAAKRHPLRVGIVTTVLKTSAADAFAQTVIEDKDEMDWKRNALFATFGFAYLGCFQYYLYNNLFVSITPAITRAVGAAFTPAALVFLDQAVHHPLAYFPTFYIMKGAMEAHELSSSTVSTSLERYRHDAWDNMKACWMVWVPAQLVNFSVVPLHLRIPFVAAVSFGWTVILSALRGELHVPHRFQHHQDDHLHASSSSSTAGGGALGALASASSGSGVGLGALVAVKAAADSQLVGGAAMSRSVLGSGGDQPVMLLNLGGAAPVACSADARA